MRDAWVRAVVGRGGNAEKAAASARELLARYGEAHRSYHTEQHVVAMLSDVELLAEDIVLDSFDRDVLTLAICAHDVVYNGKPGEDERASAAWARRRLTDAGVSEDVVDRVEALVLATITHEADGQDALADVLLDVDLAILGAPEEKYDAYVWAVRAEYSHVADDHWRTGRAAVLRSLVERDVLYRTTDARRRWDSAARNNIRRELGSL
ncbi:HD domain-containing protein [Allokutzneria albata]|uniref:Predicted metal-dependent phosphohydrolase, HD superfamily n=1 Tax=Allokutzneria albata TaxID=211114 RepID=A0A1G9ZAS2_ALLAB|nr:hypothetical protein [Allokutzneria albata]SDN18429.1 Predicted metal-dependent phosphohydrolase, HD superfamily [Allokutzneria albata]